MKLIFFLILHVLFFAQDFTKSAFPIMRMGQSAYSLALGNASVSGDANSASFITNPASLMGASSNFVAINMQFLSLDRRVYSFSYYQPLHKKTFFSLGWIHATVNDLYQFSSQAEKGREIGYGDNIFVISAGILMNKRFSTSLSIKYMLQSINGTRLKNYNAKAIVIDLSAFYKLDDALQVGFLAQNLIHKLSTNSEKIFEVVHAESLPKIFVFGFKSTYLSEQLLNIRNIALLIDYKIIEDHNNTIHFGLDARMARSFFLRLGLDNAEFRAGFGLDISVLSHTFTFDYAYLNSSIDAGTSHVLSWMLNL